MTTFDWHACFKQHPVFWDLAEEELNKFLDDRLSKEVICQPNQVIIREGEQGDSVFFVGEGEVNVVLKGDSGPGTNIAILGPGEFFGEMAVLEGRPRMATVVSRDRCTLLEIVGSRFRDFLIKHPEIEFKIAAKLSQRLRDVTEHVLTSRFKDVDQKLELFNHKLESELRVIDASMKATQAVFDQTNKRANEIIESAERSRNQLRMTAAAIGVVIAVLGFLGFEKVIQIEPGLETLKKFEDKLPQIESLEEKLSQIESLEEKLPQINLIEVKLEKINQLEQKFSTMAVEQLLLENNTSARQHYEELMRLNDKSITIRLFKIIYRGLFVNKITGESDNTVRDDYIDFLEYSIGDDYLTPEQEVISYYLMLSTMVMAGMDKRCDRYLRAYQVSASKYRATGRSLKQELEGEFDPDTFFEYLELEYSGDILQSKKETLQEIWNTVP